MAKESYPCTNIDGKPLCGCEVCWTCAWFDHSDKVCKFIFRGAYQTVESFKSPGLFRCSYWEEEK